MRPLPSTRDVVGALSPRIHPSPLLLSVVLDFCSYEPAHFRSSSVPLLKYAKEHAAGGEGRYPRTRRSEREGCLLGGEAVVSFRSRQVGKGGFFLASDVRSLSLWWGSWKKRKINGAEWYGVGFLMWKPSRFYERWYVWVPN